jgi:eukaryotic-like serine/threonine-protein kinase
VYEGEPRVVGRYAIYGEIAAGGMATVHLGRLRGPVGFSKTVAIKRLHEQFAKDDEFVTMFIDEARLAARIHHPNVVQTLDVVQEDRQLLLVMEYVHGVQLSTLTRLARKRGKPMPPAIVVAIVAGMLRGLHAAHDATDEQGAPLNIVHRDVSPHNVLVGADGVPRVIDFGIAKASGRLQQTATGQVKGKVPYMAPEQVKGQQVTRRTDIFAAGVVLWETLLGERLFRADNDAAIISEILSRQIDPPSKVDFSIAPAFDEVVMRALDRDPKKRFATALEMAEALEKCERAAPPSEVATFVELVAADQLAKRQTLVSSVESTSGHPAMSRRSSASLVEPTTNASSSVSVATNAPRRSIGFVLGFIALLGMGGIGYFLAHAIMSRDPGTAPSIAPKIAGSPPASASSSAPTAAPSVSASIAPSASKSTAPTLKPKIKQTAAPVDCDPPYTFDANGMKKYKPQCL